MLAFMLAYGGEYRPLLSLKEKVHLWIPSFFSAAPKVSFLYKPAGGKLAIASISPVILREERDHLRTTRLGVSGDGLSEITRPSRTAATIQRRLNDSSCDFMPNIVGMSTLTPAFIHDLYGGEQDTVVSFCPVKPVISDDTHSAALVVAALILLILNLSNYWWRFHILSSVL
ncbi:hypothetical protein FOZ62_029638 [Perkinsus olseni]|uniref:Uncharacterized protein n=1 Tax=Perkinsus olseni TaxID=32597 RepID=A0A7J6QUQ0_PEROL|nr:hypothetical protein FOZ62_029638 [Perkinsus olseni]